MQNRCVALAELAPEIELIKSKEQVAGILRSAPKFSDVPGNSFGQEREADLSGLNEKWQVQLFNCSLCTTLIWPLKDWISVESYGPIETHACLKTFGFIRTTERD